VPSSAIGSVLASMLGSVVENVLGGVPGSVLGVYLGASSELTWERIVKQAGSVIQCKWECTRERARACA